MSSADKPSNNCPPDVNGITQYINQKMAWSAIPFVGPNLGDKYAKPPPDGQDDLNDAQAQLEQSTSEWQSDITQLVGEDVLNLNSLLQIFGPYVDAVSTLKELPDKQNINILYIQVASIMIILVIIIFFGIHK